MDDIAITAVFLGVLGFIGIGMSAGTIWEYGERIMGNINSYTDLYHTNYTTARQSAYADQKLINLAETIWKVRDMAIEDERIQVAAERTELYELLAQAAVLVDTIRARS